MVPAFAADRAGRWTEERPGYAPSVTTADRFWTRRLRWRLLGAWRWPLFLLLTLADALIVNWLPPAGARALFFPALIICSFANLVLIGAIAPWLARRLAARQGEQPATPTFPPANHVELLTDRIASVVLVLGTLGLLAAGAGNRETAVADTKALGRAGDLAVAYASAHGPPAARVRFRQDALNTHVLEEERLYRMCVPLNERGTRNYCMYVDLSRKPPSVKPDPDTRPNELVYGAG
jgi:hypothetical protein